MIEIRPWIIKTCKNQQYFINSFEGVKVDPNLHLKRFLILLQTKYI